MLRKQFFLNCGLLLAALFFIWILLEFLLGLVGISYPYFTQIDPDTGFSLRPGAEGWSHDEGNVYIRINSDGLRDREHSIEKPANTVRIAVLGDSYAEARQVGLENTFWSQMEKNVGTCPALADQKIEVINFGVSGFSTAQELQMLRSRVWKYAPDIVLLAFLSGNDVKDNSPVLARHDREPFFRETGSGIALDTSFRETAFFKNQQAARSRMLFALINRSRVLQMINRARIILRNRQEAPMVDHPGAGIEVGLDPDIYRDPPQKPWDEAWRITEKIIGLMHRETRDHGAEFIVAGITNGIQVHPEPAARSRFAERIGVPDLSYPERRLTALGIREGFAYLPLVPRMAQEAERSGAFYHGFPGFPEGTGHWNEEGHRMAGSLLSTFICAGTGR